MHFLLCILCIHTVRNYVNDLSYGVCASMDMSDIFPDLNIPVVLTCTLVDIRINITNSVSLAGSVLLCVLCLRRRSGSSYSTHTEPTVKGEDNFLLQAIIGVLIAISPDDCIIRITKFERSPNELGFKVAFPALFNYTVPRYTLPDTPTRASYYTLAK